MNTIQIKIDDNYDLLGIDDDVENGISIYPQSGNGNFTINWPQEADVQQILIVNALGQQIYNEKVNGNLSLAVNLAAPQGFYQVSLFGAENQFVKQGDVVMSILPENTESLIGRMQIPSANSGKVQTGQKVLIKLDN